MRKTISILFLSPLLLFVTLISSCDDSKGKDKLTVGNLIEAIDGYKTELLKTTSLTEFIETEKQTNEDLAIFCSSTEPLKGNEVDPLVTAILDFNRETYVHRLNIEGRNQSRDEIESLNESLDDLEISMKILAEKSKTVGEFLTAIYGG